jgi:hypothetical protein
MRAYRAKAKAAVEARAISLVLWLAVLPALSGIYAAADCVRWSNVKDFTGYAAH